MFLNCIWYLFFLLELDQLPSLSHHALGSHNLRADVFLASQAFKQQQNKIIDLLSLFIFLLQKHLNAKQRHVSVWSCMAVTGVFGQRAAKLPSVFSTALGMGLQHLRWLWEEADGSSVAEFGIRSHHEKKYPIIVHD